MTSKKKPLVTGIPTVLQLKAGYFGISLDPSHVIKLVKAGVVSLGIKQVLDVG